MLKLLGRLPSQRHHLRQVATERELTQVLKQLKQMHQSRTLGEKSDAFWSFTYEMFWWYAAVLSLCVILMPEHLWVIGTYLLALGGWLSFIWLLEHIADLWNPGWRKQLRHKYKQDSS